MTTEDKKYLKHMCTPYEYIKVRVVPKDKSFEFADGKS